MKNISALASLISLSLVGCGGDGSNDNSQPAPTPAPTSKVIIGTAATGAPINGEITVTDANGNTLSYIALEDGRFEFNKSKIVTPALIKAEGAAAGGSHKLYSAILNGESVANVTPFTQILISRVTGKPASEVYNNFDLYKDQITSKALQKAQEELKQVISPLLIAAGVADDFDLIGTQFDANYKSIDAVLDLVDILFADNSAMIIYKADGGYAEELKFDESWNGKALTKNGVELDPAIVIEPLGYIVSADNVLEQMVMQQDESEYLKYVHPSAFWYGQAASDMFEQKQSILPNEKDEMNRYKDFALTQVDDDGSFLLSFTECYQDSPFATCGRAKAWFAKDSDDKIKFMGRKDKLPINISAILIAHRGHWREDQTDIDWSIEIDAFPDASTICGKIPEAYNNTSWFAGVPKLVKMADYMNIQKVTISGNGINSPVNMDSIYKEVNNGKITACHLVDSTYGYPIGDSQFMPYSLVIDGYAVADDQDIPDNSTFNVEYHDEKGFLKSEKISISKGKDSNANMAKYIATLEESRTNAGDFYMKWSRESKIATDIDVWATEANSSRGSVRVTVAEGANEIKTDKLDIVERAYLISFDEYGRSISVGYDFTN
jgi:hypothetical protein